MSESLATKTVMLSALDEWSTLDELSELAKRMLPPERASALGEPLRKTAQECLDLISAPPAQRRDQTAAAELPEVVTLQKKLRKMTSVLT